MLKVTVKYNIPIGNFKAIEKTETFRALSMFEAPGTSLVYFKTDGFNWKPVSKSEIVSITE